MSSTKPCGSAGTALSDQGMRLAEANLLYRKHTFKRIKGWYTFDVLLTTAMLCALGSLMCAKINM